MFKFSFAIIKSCINTCSLGNFIEMFCSAFFKTIKTEIVITEPCFVGECVVYRE